MIKANNDIRKTAKESGVFLWEIADKLGYTDHYFSRKLRKEFTAEEKARAFEAIEQIKQERAK